MANYAPAAKIEEAKHLRSVGCSLRLIAKKTGLNRETVAIHVGKISRSESMRVYHAVRKDLNPPDVNIAESKPVRKKKRFVPIGIAPTPPTVPEIPKPIVKPPSGKYRFDQRKRLTVEEETDLWTAFKQGGDVSARDLIVRCNLHYVVTIAKIMHKTTSSLETAIAEGNYGLLRAVEGFEPERGLRFITYAAYWIRTYISKYLQASRTIINKPLITTKIIYKVRRERAHATNSVGVAPDAVASIVSAKLGLTIDKVHDLFERLDCRDVSLDSKAYAEGYESMVDTLASDIPTADEVLEHNVQSKIQQTKIAAALSLLSPREKIIVEERFMTDDPLPLAELGRRFGVSRERVRQLEVRSVRKLRQTLSPLVRENLL